MPSAQPTATASLSHPLMPSSTSIANLSSTPPSASARSGPLFVSPSPKSFASRAGQDSSSATSLNAHRYNNGSVSRNGPAAAHPSIYSGSLPIPPSQTIAHPTQPQQPQQPQPQPRQQHPQQQQQQQRRQVFAASLPRTSSLLPPPRITSEYSPSTDPIPPTFQNPFNAQPIEPLSRIDQSPPRRESRSSSVGGSEGFRNLNRWSASTASSPPRSSFGHRKNSSFGRSHRISVDVAGSHHHSPRKLHKDPPSSSARRTPSSPRGRSNPSPSALPLQALPRIISLPSLEAEFDGTVFSPPTSPDTRQGNTTEPPSPRSAARNTTMPHNHNGEARGHSRTWSTGAKGSTDTSSSRPKSRERSNKQPSQKAMLSRALQKANVAVQLDNAQDPEGARRAYAEACDLLQQVLARTPGEDDRKKLEAIHKTYTSRIVELDQILPPAAPEGGHRRSESHDRQTSSLKVVSNGSNGADPSAAAGQTREGYGGGGGGTQAIPNYSTPTATARRSPSTQLPHLPPPVETSHDPSSSYHHSLQSNFSRSPRTVGNGFGGQHSTQQAPRTEDNYVPPPLSPRRPGSVARQQPGEEREYDPRSRSDSVSSNRLTPAPSLSAHNRVSSHESISWLDPIDESGASSASSVHSRSSSLRVTRKHIRAASGNTEAEFDAALDDAIEAAYDDGYDPESHMGDPNAYNDDPPEDAVAKALRRVQLARERVRESEREAMELANEREMRLRLQQQQLDEEELQYQNPSRQVADFYDGNDSDEEEERLLEELGKGYAIENLGFGAQSKAPVPRESDSSWTTSRTWHTSMGSNPPTATTTLTTVSENTITTSHSKPPSSQLPPPPPPTQALPQPPSSDLPASPPSLRSPPSPSNQSVRSRRLSGQNPKQLKIETTKLHRPGPATAAVAPTQSKSSAGGYIVQQRQALSAGLNRPGGPLSARQVPSPAPGAYPGTPPVPSSLAQEAEPGRSGSPAVSRPILKQNFSSSSLKNLQSRNPSLSNIDDAVADLSPGTPMSNQFGISGSTSRLPAMPSLPTPMTASFKDRMNNASTGGLYLFESDFHSPQSPDASNPLLGDTPVPLEPCPSETMLRPFWLMRCLYQTLCHPRGGYLSSKLFVPRDVWRVKGVKLKNVEDKISNCDLLTAALQKLSKVDTCDADAVLEEMQSLEGILEQSQSVLTRRLGSEVGVQSAGNLFKEANITESGELGSSAPRSASVSAKSSGFSWRRLRSKNSAAALASSGKGGNGSVAPVDGTAGGSAKDSILPSLPMTNTPTKKPVKRDISSVKFGGPNAQYMAALARLFDAAQMVDQIARQVEDPGLRHADKTQVGLELCTRHAAEFFGFYICRFALADLMMLLDKFIKRGSEWVLV